MSGIGTPLIGMIPMVCCGSRWFPVFWTVNVDICWPTSNMVNVPRFTGLFTGGLPWFVHCDDRGFPSLPCLMTLEDSQRTLDGTTCCPWSGTVLEKLPWWQSRLRLTIRMWKQERSPLERTSKRQACVNSEIPRFLHFVYYIYTYIYTHTQHTVYTDGYRNTLAIYVYYTQSHTMCIYIYYIYTYIM